MVRRFSTATVCSFLTSPGLSAALETWSGFQSTWDLLRIYLRCKSCNNFPAASERSLQLLSQPVFLFLCWTRRGNWFVNSSRSSRSMDCKPKWCKNKKKLWAGIQIRPWCTLFYDGHKIFMMNFKWSDKNTQHDVQNWKSAGGNSEKPSG